MQIKRKYPIWTTMRRTEGTASLTWNKKSSSVSTNNLIENMMGTYSVTLLLLWKNVPRSRLLSAVAKFKKWAAINMRNCPFLYLNTNRCHYRRSAKHNKGIGQLSSHIVWYPLNPFGGGLSCEHRDYQQHNCHCVYLGCYCHHYVVGIAKMSLIPV